MDQNEIIRRLSCGEGFGGIPPERIDTHISALFLAGEDVYKLKRAVSTSYLDYAALEKRRRFCLAELDINRRTAPQTYLDVVPVRRTPDDRLVIGEGPGETVEWLVHMRRFAQENLFDNLAQAGRLSPALLISLADEIAAFHRSAAVVEDAEAAGRIGYVIDENAAELEGKAAGLIEGSMIETFDRACRSVFDRVKGVIDRRGRQGFVRHCHGDLHLRNICLIEGKPTLFDAIEFSDRISHIDVLFDFAFLVMDLEHRGLRREANIVFNRYLYRTGDLGDLSAFPLYLALRAGIRAHVSAMAAATLEKGQNRDNLREEANAYLRLGLEQFKQVPPRLIAVGGVSGSGKSTIAHDIAPHIGLAPGALVLSSDLIRKKILGVEPLTRLGQGAYNAATNKAVYGELIETAMRVLAGGYTAVLDATFLDQDQRERLTTAATSAGVPFKGFWLEANREALRERILRRVADPSDATVSILESQLERDVGKIDWRRINAAQTTNVITATIRQALDADGGAGATKEV